MKSLFVPPPSSKPRRNRKNNFIRDLVAENQISVNDLVAPLFLIDGQKKKIPIEKMPNQFRFSLDEILKEIKILVDLSIKAIVLFPVIEEEKKDSMASYSYDENNFYLGAITKIKKEFPFLQIISDVAMDPYSSDGHDGIVQNGKIDNEKTLPILCKMALAQANAGSDFIAPSDMMDGRVMAIRNDLDKNNFLETSILSYTAKYASYFYDPFRDALNSTPKSGDKKTYQMDFRNGQEALREMNLDIHEGADILMVKPGICYLDILEKLRHDTNLPLAVYQVSGEYAMLKLAINKGIFDFENILLETTIAFKRAGANLIFTYFAKDLAEILAKK